jgi:hypothetical protein
MGKRNKIGDAPASLRLQITFNTQGEYDEFASWADREGGSYGPFARAQLLKAARAANTAVAAEAR